MALDEYSLVSGTFADFVAESREAFQRVEPLLGELERTRSGPDAEVLGILFRCFHSFEGTTAFIGLEVASALAHSAGCLLQLFRTGSAIEPQHLEGIRAAVEALRSVLDTVEKSRTDEAQLELCQQVAWKLDEFVDLVRSRLPVDRHHSRRQRFSYSPTPNLAQAESLAGRRASETEAAQRGGDHPSSVSDASRQAAQHTLLMLPPDLLAKFVSECEEHLGCLEDTLLALEAGKANAERIAEAFRAMHSLKGNCGLCGCGDMEQLAHAAETLLGLARTAERKIEPSSVSLLIEVIDVLRGTLAGATDGQVAIEGLAMLISRLDSACSGQPSLLQRSTSAAPQTMAGRKAMPRAESAAESVRGPDSSTGMSKLAETIRVDTSKLDELMTLVGELIIAETTVTKNPDLEGHEFENFQKAALNLNRLTRALQDIATSVRMVPIADTFRKMVRLVRDVSTKQHKQVELVIAGEDTEVDKTVIECMADPLVHLIRNAVDHGIESTEERLRLGKPAVGRVWLSARHQGGEVWITLRDDGRGLNPEQILTKAIEQKLADATRRYTEREIVDMIFAPGFSTATTVSDISGRGVGMDVARKNIEIIGGRIETTSQLGVGTTFTLRIPLTLAIIEGMLVKVGRSFYTIPLLSIRESVRAERKNITMTSDGRELLKLRRRHYPIIRLHELHAVAHAEKVVEKGILVIVEQGERLACLLVDEVVGQCQTVIKALPEYLRRVRGLSGCSILHNGEISLILDVEGVVGATHRRAA
jgi:two-component system, chemotaxis family, sensor kinase CheA